MNEQHDRSEQAEWMPGRLTIHTSHISVEEDGVVVTETRIVQVLRQCRVVEPPQSLRMRIIAQLRREAGCED